MLIKINLEIDVGRIKINNILRKRIMIQDYKYSMINVTVQLQVEAGRIKINNVFKLGKE